MRGLTLTQPWASLVALGHKRYETRSWRTPYTGPIVIHAAKGYPRDARDFTEELVEDGVLPTIRLPLGSVVAVARLVCCVATEHYDAYQSSLSNAVPPATNEREYGGYGPGRFFWPFADVRQLEVPVPYKGSLGLWHASRELCEAVGR